MPLPTQGNEIFVILPRRTHEALLAKGVRYHDWPGEGPGADEVRKDEIFVRFVTSFQTIEKDVDALAGLLAKLSG